MIEIREERAGDIAAIRELNLVAFGQAQEANLVDALRANGAVLLSLVAILDARVVGHVLYSPLYVNDMAGAALGPMAVAPKHQRRGIGSKLVAAGSDRLRASGCPFIVLVGHPEFYPRFGFEPAAACGVTSEWDLPGDVFMVSILDDAKRPAISGLAKYRAEFSSVS